MTKQDIIEYVMNTPHNTNKAVLSSMLNQLVEGGGGSSDFSTAEVSFVYNKEGSGWDSVSYIPIIHEANDSWSNSTCADAHITGDCEVLDNYGSYYKPSKLTVALYKGKASGWCYNNNVNMSVSGNASYDSDNQILTITGDCTITLS